MINSMRSGATAIPEANVLQLHTDLVTTQGIVSIVGTQFQVTANTNLTVSVAAGRAYLTASGGNTYPIINNAAITVTVNANSSGNPRITSIVLYENLSATPGTDGSNTATVIAVDGTPAPSPSAPSGSTIQTAVGSSNPYTVLCNITIPSGVSNLFASATLADVRTQVTFLGGGVKSRIFLGSAGSIPSGTDTKILLDSITTDPNSLFDATNHRIVINAAGDYEVLALATFSSPGASGRLGAEIFKNGSVVVGPNFVNGNGATSIGSFVADILFGLAVNDVIELYGFQDTGGSKSLTVGSGNTFMTLRKVG